MKNINVKKWNKTKMVAGLLLFSVAMVLADSYQCYVQSVATCIKSGSCVADCQDHYCPPWQTPFKTGVFAQADCNPPVAIASDCGGEGKTDGVFECTIPVMIITWNGCGQLSTYTWSTGSQDCSSSERGQQGRCPPCGILASL
jgi:hypothetical protein